MGLFTLTNIWINDISLPSGRNLAVGESAVFYIDDNIFEILEKPIDATRTLTANNPERIYQIDVLAINEDHANVAFRRICELFRDQFYLETDHFRIKQVKPPVRGIQGVDPDTRLYRFTGIFAAKNITRKP